MKIISLINSKGGVGKTTLALNLARYVQMYYCKIVPEDICKKVLLVDADEQGTLRTWHNVGGCQHLDLIIADTKQSIAKLPNILKESNYDFVFIDTPPTMNEIIGSAVNISDVVLIPIKPSAFDVWASKDVRELIELRHSFLGAKSPETFYVLNQCVRGSISEREVKEYLYTCTIVPLYQSIYGCEKFKATASEGGTIFDSGMKKAIIDMEMLGFQLLQKLFGEDLKHEGMQTV